MKRAPEVRQSTRHLKCELSDAELLESGKALADRSAELVALENEKTRIMSDFGARIKGREADISILTNRIQSRYEFRDVLCEEWLDDPKPGKKTVRRTDTQEVVAIEDMTASEMQRELEVA